MADKKQLISFLKEKKESIITDSISSLQKNLQKVKDELKEKKKEILTKSNPTISVDHYTDGYGFDILLSKINNSYYIDDYIVFKGEYFENALQSIIDLTNQINDMKISKEKEISDLILDLVLNGADDSIIDRVKKLTSQP